MKATVKIDKLSLSLKSKNQINFKCNRGLPGYEYEGYFNPDKDELDDEKVYKYKSIGQFRHENGNRLIVCWNVKKKTRYATPLYIIFYTQYQNTINYQDVYPIEQFFCKKRLSLSQVHVAVDLISDKKIDLCKTVIHSLKPGYKALPSIVYDTSIYFGNSSSSNSLIVYDKIKQMISKEKVKNKKDLESKLGINLPGDVCRIEVRFNIPKSHNFIQTIDDLAVYDWSFLHSNHFSLRLIKPQLIDGLKTFGINLNLPLWGIRDAMKCRFNIVSSNFYRDYLTDHPYSTLIQNALEDFRWCMDYQRHIE